MSLVNVAKDSCSNDDCAALQDTIETQEGWHVIWTCSNFEQSVRDQLVAKDYQVFLPMIKQWSIRQQLREEPNVAHARTPLLSVPMFKGYMFVRNCMDKKAYIDISNTKGVVQILGSRWDRPARIPDEEIESIQLLMDCQQPLLPYPYLKSGSKVRIIRGALANAEGVLVDSDRSKGVFVVSVALLRSSVAVNVDCCDVVPI